MKFEEVLEHFSNGGKITREKWLRYNKNAYIHAQDYYKFWTENGEEYHLDLRDLNADDWIIIEEREE